MALTILCYSFFAKRPLRIDELSHALAVKAGSTTFDKDRITDADVSEATARSCAGLIVLDKTNNTVNMFHKTLHDYLVDNHSKWFPDGGESLGRTCVAYLSLEDFAHGPCPEVDPSSLWSRSLAQDKTQLLRKRFVQYPFYEYASQHWPDHIRGSQSETADVVLRFLADAKKLSASCQTLKLTAPETKDVYVAARFSLERSLVHCLQRHRLPLYDVNARDHDGRTLLSYAAEMNSLEAVRLLLEAGADLSMESEGKGFGASTPLLYAASRGHADTVTLLLDKGADVRSKDREGRSALAHASKCGSQAVTQLLLERGADPNSRDLSQRTPLFYAAAAGSESVVELLLERGVWVNLTDCEMQTPLHLAVKAGSDYLISILIAKGANVDAEGRGHGDTPLSRAFEAGAESAFELLLKSGAGMGPSRSAENLLNRAMQTGSKTMERLLVSAGVKLQDGWADMLQLQLLSDNGAKANKEDICRLLDSMEYGQWHGSGRRCG